MTELVFGHEGGSRLKVEKLTRAEAEHSIDKLTELANLIPEVSYIAEDILAEEKPDGRDLSSKWRHSYVLREDGEIIGLIVGYLRYAEANDQYPVDSLYMSELAIDSSMRGNGYGKKLVTHYLEEALKEGIDNFTLQTNAAGWNESVRELYERFGFHTDGSKEYENREDVIMRASAEGVRESLSRHENH